MDSTILVVGGTGAIGKACVRDLVTQNNKVIVADVNGKKAASVAKQLEAVRGVFVDVRDPESIEAAVQSAEEVGPLRAAINVAGVAGTPVRLHESSDEDWRRVVDINLTGLFNCLRSQINTMLGRAGAIVNISSVTGRVGFPSAATYSASKHAVEGLTKASALEYAADGIRINAVTPGFIETEMLKNKELHNSCPSCDTYTP